MQTKIRSVLWLFIVFVSNLSFADSPSEKLNGFQLADCPNRPNCVSTQSSNPDQSVVALKFSKDSSEVIEVIQTEVLKLERTTLVKQSGGYLHFEFRSRIFRFVDDVEFKLDSENKTIHFRSSSRTGYSDLGVNRERYERIKSIIAGKI